MLEYYHYCYYYHYYYSYSYSSIADCWLQMRANSKSNSHQ